MIWPKLQKSQFSGALNWNLQITVLWILFVEKQQFRGVLEKSLSKILENLLRNWLYLSGKVAQGVLKSFAKFTGKQLCQSLFFHKVAGLMTATLLKKRLWHSRFPMNFAKFLRTTFFIEHPWWLLQTSSLVLLISMKKSLEMSVINFQLLTPLMFGTKKFKRYYANCI